MKNLLSISAAIVSIGSSAYAADNNDIILGFWATGGVGSAVSAEFVLADTSALKPQQTLNVLTNINGLLTATYGSDWSTRSDIYFGYVGTVQNLTTGTGSEPGKTNFVAASASGSLLDGQSASTPYNRKSVTGSATPSAKITGLWSAFAGNTSVVTVNDQPNSWGYQGGISGWGNSFPSESFDNKVDFSAKSYVASDLYEMMPGSGPGTYLGTFALYANGDVAFVNMASAIPEPSTYAAILGAAALGFAALRRRQLASA